MNSRDIEIFVTYLNDKRAMLSGDAHASLALLKEAGIVSDSGYIVRKHRIIELTGSLNDRAQKLIVSKNFTTKKHRNRCIPNGRG